MATEVHVKERPILFSGPMVNAILEGRKTQTRRVVTPQPELNNKSGHWYFEQRGGSGYVSDTTLRSVLPIHSPYGQPGDRLWVRETHAYHFGKLLYRADCHPESYEYGAKGWRPSIFMPRALSRITLELTDVRVERVQEISEGDAWAEGVSPGVSVIIPHDAGRRAFASLWDQINAKRGYAWDSNPWVWVLTFRKIGYSDLVVELSPS